MKPRFMIVLYSKTDPDHGEIVVVFDDGLDGGDAYRVPSELCEQCANMCLTGDWFPLSDFPVGLESLDPESGQTFSKQVIDSLRAAAEEKIEKQIIGSAGAWDTSAMTTGPIPNASTDFSVEAMQRAMAEGRRMMAEQSLSEGEINLDLLRLKCPSCGHTPRVEGPKLFCCRHWVDRMKEKLPVLDPVQNPLANFAGLQIMVEDKRELKDE